MKWAGGEDLEAEMKDMPYDSSRQAYCVSRRADQAKCLSEDLVTRWPRQNAGLCTGRKQNRKAISASSGLQLGHTLELKGSKRKRNIHGHAVRRTAALV